IRNAPADERDAMFEEFQRIENEIGPFVPLLLPPTVIASAERIEGLVLTPSGDFDITQISVK
ncbi:MAG: hypothetical protein QM602_06010, partial [Microbacterium sp.]